MSKATCSAVLLLAFFLVSSQARSILSRKPQPLTSFKIDTNSTHPLTVTKINSTLTAAAPSATTTGTQKVGSCTYTVVFTTSCSSPSYTRDRISLAFGDAYGSQVYATRLDDPSSGAFEACSTDTYDISGSCTYDVCYLYVYRSGYDGWKLKSVEVYGYHRRSISFYYNTFIPRDVWYGNMGEVRDNEAYEEELLDYEEEDEKAPDSVNNKPSGESAKKGYVGIHSSGFRDFLLKPELLRAIVDSGFEHPSEGKVLTSNFNFH
ncbi:hypothetical protein RHGRI_024877 [Rhododendron griersonianum]|uniref:Uncharacterized protein n=1 Tax=Rhododendron griersonianum TaxID=479676 RepID=A0AAV6JB63_9ERIC|nr:hypothetical protein RHGRI_024877 [Rhododendron griersonianum]